MSKKNEKKKLTFEIDDNEYLFEIFMTRSKDGMIIGNTSDKGKYFTSLPNKKTIDFSIHRTETQPDGTKNYPERKEFGDFIRIFINSIENPKSSSEILNELSENTYIFPLSFGDYNTNKYIKENENKAKINIIKYFKDNVEIIQANEKLDKKNFELISKKYSKGFLIIDLDKEKLYFIKPTGDRYFVLDTSGLVDYINFFSKLIPEINDDKLEIIKKKI